ncbi:hypothetical protein A1D25_01755 [Ursidibacter arcticus]|uniref:hypothetical protein n=1 Tax=Ursidibacter arcticus TaxID=1524965 RepID=UPI0012FAE4D9|nr:hypothetical protein [Ursidibacter arcticus]KAE9531841.1 hypothetical protein A1D25_01755 [Ursidibacter arcticus]
MPDALEKLIPIFAKMKKCQNDDQAIEVMRKYVDEGNLSKDECFILGWLYHQEQQKNNKILHTRQENQEKKSGFVMRF